MPSLLDDSLEFLAQQIDLSSRDLPSAVHNIGMRTIHLRAYADPVTEELEFDDVPEGIVHSTTVEPEQQHVDTSRTVTGIPENTHTIPPIPNIPGVDPDVLRNLLMSWFYCGYYSGLAHSTSKTK